jgi:Xaa-Pro aminopeptidase
MITERIAGLRELMASRGIDAYIVPSSDPHQSEYVPACWKRRQWISGFTGSAGTVVVTRQEAGLWTDGRYHVQAAQELDPGVYSLFRVGLSEVQDFPDWLARVLGAGDAVGVDPKVISVEEARRLTEKLEGKGIALRFVEENLVDLLWEDRPSMPADPVFAQPEALAGESVASKLSRVQEEMVKEGADAHVVPTLDGVAWLFNLRGTDVPFNPVFVGYGMVTRRAAVLFVDPAKVGDPVRGALGGMVSFQPYERLGEYLDEGVKGGWRFWIDPRVTSQWVLERLAGRRRPMERPSPVIALKAVKNDVERRGMRACHVRDGAAMVRFLRWLEETVPLGGVTECSAAARLDALRAEAPEFRGVSFETIAGYQGHGAVIHYRPDPATDCEIRPEGLLLVDSGGQYLDGTTDVTRTVALGPATQEQRERFTRVLKGHIGLARLRFPKGTTGRQLDAMARQHLWEVGLDYRHGTGHGVGCFLNVHEGPQSISARDTGVALEPGMFVSNEPGYYHEGAYGIRIESVVMVTEEEALKTQYGPFYAFETVTMVPIDRRLVDEAMLSAGERDWLNAYHAKVRERLFPELGAADRMWLLGATEPL